MVYNSKYFIVPAAGNPDSKRLVPPNVFLKSKTTPMLGFDVLRLSRENVTKSPVLHGSKPLDTKYSKGEKLFGQAFAILQANFPKSEIETERQYRDYFYDKYSKRWHFEVAVDKNTGNVLAVSLYSYCPDINAVMYNLVVVEKSHRGQGIATGLISGAYNRMKVGPLGVKYVLGEIEKPDMRLQGLQGRMRNYVRPNFHAKVTGLKAVQLANGEPFTYLLPDMNAKNSQGKMENGELMFCLKKAGHVRGEYPNEILGSGLAKLVAWFYLSYISKECPNVDPLEVRRLLAQALAPLIPDAKITALEELLSKKRVDIAKISKLAKNLDLKLVDVTEIIVRETTKELVRQHPELMEEPSKQLEY